MAGIWSRSTSQTEGTFDLSDPTPSNRAWPNIKDCRCLPLYLAICFHGSYDPLDSHQASKSHTTTYSKRTPHHPRPSATRARIESRMKPTMTKGWGDFRSAGALRDSLVIWMQSGECWPSTNPQYWHLVGSSTTEITFSRISSSVNLTIRLGSILISTVFFLAALGLPAST